MPPKFRPTSEPLEGRMMLTATPAPTLTAVSGSPIGSTAMVAALTSTIHPIAAVGSGESLSTQVPNFDIVNGAARVSQSSTSATITLQRYGPGTSTPVLDDSLTVQVATIASRPTDNVKTTTAVAGLQYVPIQETVTFPPGVSSLPITIPIISGAANPGRVAFEFIASEVAPSTAPGTIVSLNQEVDIVAPPQGPIPTVASAHMVNEGRHTSDFVLKFAQPMDLVTASRTQEYTIRDNTAHYHNFGAPLGLILGESPPNFAGPITIKSATYNAATMSVNLHLARPVDSRDVYAIGNASVTPGLLDASGTLLNQDAYGNNGFSATVTNKKATSSVTNAPSPF